MKANVQQAPAPILNKSCNLLPADGDLNLLGNFFKESESLRLFKQLKKEIVWQQYHIRIFGKLLPQPRLTAWYGEEGASYCYSGLLMEPMPYTPTLLAIKKKVEEQCACSFNSVLVNLYRNQNDSMGWHSDDEKELGKNPLIVSLSLGTTRTFQLRHKTKKNLKLRIPLLSGGLLFMSGCMQHHWQHAIPKSTQVCGPRINLTFRNVVQACPEKGK